LLGFSVGYLCLFILSLVFLVPRFLSGEIGGYLLPLLFENEPEVQLEVSFLLPYVWILIPFASIVFCCLSWVAYSVSLKATRAVEELMQALGTVLLALSIFPTLLVVREFLFYEPFGLTGGLLSLQNGLNELVFGPLTRLVNPALLLSWGGTWGVPAIIFVETGLFFGFFLPGDSLLVAVGVLATLGDVNLVVLIPSTILAAIAGDQLNYFIGQKSGGPLADRFQFVHTNLERARLFYYRHGGKAILLARFVPVIRTFAPAVAGAARMNYVRFVLFNVTGGALWVVSMVVIGYSVGSIIPNVTQYLDLVIVTVILVSVAPSGLLWAWRRIQGRQSRERVLNIRKSQGTQII
jgi:membrane-associated protein